MVTTDIGNVCSVANSYLRFDAPNSFFAAMSFGNCGYAFPTAMGAKVAAPERPAVAYVGDGAWGMSLNEVLTCVRERIPATAVVFNNGQWGAEKKNQIDYYADRYVGTNLVNPSFAGIARAMGAERHHRRRAGPDRRRAARSDRGGPLHRARDQADPGAGRAVPPRRAEEAQALPRQVQGLRSRLNGSPGAAPPTLSLPRKGEGSARGRPGCSSPWRADGSGRDPRGCASFWRATPSGCGRAGSTSLPLDGGGSGWGWPAAARPLIPTVEGSRHPWWLRSIVGGAGRRPWLLLLAALFLALGLVGAGFLVGRGFERGRSADRYVTVKGLAETFVSAVREDPAASAMAASGLERPEEFALVVLGRQPACRSTASRPWSRVASGCLTSAAPLPVHVTYLTAWVNKDGSVLFRDDVDGRDALLADALLGASPTD